MVLNFDLQKVQRRRTKETRIDEQRGKNRCRNECGSENIDDGVNGNSVTTNGCLVNSKKKGCYRP